MGVKEDSGSGRSERDEQFHEFVADRRKWLLQTARLLTAGDPHLAEDLVQTALTKLYVSWAAFRRADNPDGYLRRVLVNAFLRERRRSWWRFERPSNRLPDRADPQAAPADLDPELSRALGQLPRRMRAAIILRFFHELDVAETAAALGCSTGTVKSQTARALDKLRVALNQPAAPRNPPAPNARSKEQELIR
ncbi:RNA polymerase sigma-70 factor (sigma-E family) [Actinoplanes octamycinicus]|uniref:RNA polymerase sigma-70 factor (Sigma-E family) n=1 Tax=Actinoplanes octamycinicus TaxID=135948 RepID=A0A7W7GTI7_9ACTN|nr:SigE family RNA polymerase sigma factor [Actinoplanes octamycinicus]MBB4737981.1 RNA polymerase sigma-70 factor (sigma-E family) [Actinoplanes octamycinicus]GIE58969.1 RNA polymerase sigma24 factor [Actinoplanes octamycinicus]